MPKIKKNLVLLFTFVLLFASIQTVAYGEENAGSWETKASMSAARYELGAAVANGKIYAIGGSNSTGYLNTVEEYDPTTDTWTTKTDMPTARCGLGVVETGGKIYAIGGFNASNKWLNAVEEYDLVTDTWTKKANMPTARQCFGVVEVGGKIYAIGGTNKALLKTVEEYDPETDTWTTKADMSIATIKFGVAQANGKIYAIGGCGVGQFLANVEEYDPETDTWTTKADMPTERYSTMAVGYNGNIYVSGGYNSKNKSLNTFEAYDPIADTWSTKEEMINERYSHCGAELNGEIYAIGGQSKSKGSLKEVEAYTLSQTPAPTPLNLTATGGDSKVTLNWNEVADCDSYNIYRSTTSGEPYDLISSSVTTSSYVDLDVTSGTTYYYVVTAVKSDGESDYSNEASATVKSIGTILDIEPEKETIKLNETITANLVIDNITEITAEDISINYDNQKLEFIGFEETDEIKLVKAIESTDSGNLRVILASKGEANIINSKKILLKLKFKGIETGEAIVDITKGRVTDGIEMEKDLAEAECDQATIIIEAIRDVNNTGEFTLIDLGIDARHLLKDPSDPELTQYNTDIVVNNAIDEEDLLEIGRLLLENPNYTPNN